MNSQEWVEQFKKREGRQPSPAEFKQALENNEFISETTVDEVEETLSKELTDSLESGVEKVQKEKNFKLLSVVLLLAGIVLLFTGFRFYKYGSLTGLSAEKSQTNLVSLTDAKWVVSEDYYFPEDSFNEERFNTENSKYGLIQFATSDIQSYIENSTLSYSYDAFKKTNTENPIKSYDKLKKEIKENTGKTDISGIMIAEDGTTYVLVNGGKTLYYTNIFSNSTVNFLTYEALSTDATASDFDGSWVDVDFDTDHTIESGVVNGKYSLMTMEAYSELIEKVNGSSEVYYHYNFTEEEITTLLKEEKKEVSDNLKVMVASNIYSSGNQKFYILDEDNDKLYQLVVDNEKYEIYQSEDEYKPTPRVYEYAK